MVTKGYIVYITISAAFVAVGCTMDLKIGGKSVQITEKICSGDSGSGIPRVATGRTAQGDVTFSVYYDDDDASHIAFETAANSPLTAFPLAMKVELPTSELITWSAAGHDIAYDFSGPLAKADITSKPTGLVTMPT